MRTQTFARRGLTLAATLIAGMTLASAGALAGACPADKVGVDVTKPGPTMPKDVTDKVLAQIDLSKEPIGIKDRDFRIRRLEIKPGGIVPWHSHGNRPALIYVVSGEITEFASNCAVPIIHKSGEVARETGATSHWWKNHGKKTVVLLSSDLHQDQHDKNM